MSLNYISKLYSQCIYQRKTLSSSYQRVSSNPPPSTTRHIVAETHEYFLQCLESRLVCHISCFWLYTRVLMMQFINTFEGVKTRCVCKPDQTLFSATTNKNGKKRSGHAIRELNLNGHVNACKRMVVTVMIENKQLHLNLIRIILLTYHFKF